MSKSHPRWRLAKNPHLAVFIAVAVLLVVYAQKVDWEEVWKVIRNYNRMVLLGATGLVIVSYLMYGCYDLLGRACGHKLAKRQVMLVSFICYAFNLTLSTWVGGLACAIASTRGSGCRAGPSRAFFPEHHHQLAGLYSARRGDFHHRRGAAARALVYRRGHAAHSGHRAAADYRRLSVGLRVCKRRHMTIKGQKLVLPSWKFAVLQMAVSSANWMAMGAIIWLLIGEDVNYFFVLGVLLVSSIAGVIVHIPAGIGVLEAVFIALAGEHVSQGTIIAALLVPHALLLPAAGAGNGLLSGAGESGEETAGEE
jgi:uncharacterized membrane protein YbhN (UPF0104 family)